MDQTFSNLMDIVKRSKSVDGASTRKPPMPKRTIPTPVEEPEEIIPVQEVEDTPSVSGSSKLSSLINRARNSAKKPTTKIIQTKATPKPAEKTNLSTIAKPLTKIEKPKAEPKPKAQPKPQPKPTEKPKTVDKVVEKTKDDIIEIAETPKQKTSKPVKRNTDATYENQLYEALQNSLFKGGTDISEFMPDTVEEENNLEEETAKDKAEKINSLISKEQQEYEQLFGGSLGSLDIDPEHRSEETVRPRLEIDGDMGVNRNNADSTFELNSGNSDLDMKIAEYYKRKQAKIDKYNKMEEEGIFDTPTKTEETEPVDYEAIFNGSMLTRDEALGIEVPEEKEEPEVVAEDTTQIDLEPTEFQNGQEVEYEPVVETTIEPIVNETIDFEPISMIPSEEPVSKEELNANKTVSENNISLTNPEPTHEETIAPVITSAIETEETPVEAYTKENPIDFNEKAETKEDRIKSALSDILYGNSSNTLKDEFMDIFNEDNSKVSTEIPASINPTEISLNSPDGIVTDSEHAVVEKVDNDAYNLSNDASIDDFVATGNIDENNNSIPEFNPFEKVTLSRVEDKLAMDDYDKVVESERLYEQSAHENKFIDNFNPMDNTTFVMGNLDTSYDFMSASTEPSPVINPIENTPVVEEKEEETISKEEFYNEMARLQNNIINELNGNKAETSGVDFFAEKPKAPVDTLSAERVVDELVSSLNENTSTTTTQDFVENNLHNEKTEELKTPTFDESTVGSKAEPVDPEKFDEYNLLNKEVALNNEDLAYQEKKYEPKQTPVDNYFYGSKEDNEKKSITDEYMTIYENNNNIKEVGDINIFKNISNATPSSEILNNTFKTELDNDTKIDEEEMETIYTLMGIQKRTINKEKENLKVLYVASECQPFVASGGLGDVAGSLPKAIAEKGDIDIRVILPLYSSIKAEYKDKFEYLGNFTVHLSWRQEYCGLFRYFSDGVTYYFVDNERYFKRDKLYGYYDDGERFAYFSKAVVESLPHLNFFPDIIHCNDWQSGLVSAYIKTGNWSDFRYYKIRNIYTIHNVEYQGVYGMENLKDLFGIDPRFRNDLEYNGDINITKAAIQYSDKFTTVSNSYCDNLKQPYCSRGLHHIIIRNEYKLSGIINGIDYKFYNPATDRHIFKNYDSVVIEDKVLNKKLWQDEIGLPVDGETPLIAVVSRLVSHKGLDLITKIIPELLTKDVQLVVVGTGDQRYVDYFKSLENKYPTKVRAFVDTYSNEIARKAYAASDIFLMPSKIEPCGLSQMIASRYGSIPIVREVGGLKDSIRDFGCEGGGNGYTFTNYNPDDLEYQLNRALKDYTNKTEWREKMKICMTQDFTWNKPAEEYIKLYKSLSGN